MGVGECRDHNQTARQEEQTRFHESCHTLRQKLGRDSASTRTRLLAVQRQKGNRPSNSILVPPARLFDIDCANDLACRIPRQRGGRRGPSPFCSTALRGRTHYVAL